MFTTEQRDRLLQEFMQENLHFEQRGKLWHLLLNKIPDQEKYICPLFDEQKALCKAYDYEIFDCRTWPFYIMRKDGNVVITLSPDCPVVAGRDPDAIIRYAHEVIGPKMIKAARKDPDLITEYHGNATILYTIDNF